MLRSILAFVSGYLAMAVVVMVLFIVGPILLGVDRVLEPGTYTASSLWVGLAAGITLLGGLVGGVVSTMVARRWRPATILAASIFIMGMVSLAMAQPKPEPPPRLPGLTIVEVLKNSAEYGSEPLFTRVSNPILGTLGILGGAALVRRRKEEGLT